MKELLHFTHPDSIVCKQMTDIIQKTINENPEIIYNRIDVIDDPVTYEYYARMNSLPPIFPIFLGIREGKLQDGHVGVATQMVLEALLS